MKRIRIVLVTIGLLFLYAGTAIAYGGPHQSFDAVNNDGCAGCHVTHAATASKLLNAGPTQTQFCLSCHDGSQSSLNAKDGVIKQTNSTIINSAAGGFDHQITNPNYNPANPSSSPTINAFTSTHILGYTQSIPGGGIGITGGLQCGSCHNPHGSPNARILKELPATTIVRFTIVDNSVASYDAGITQWCAACHNLFNVAEGSGHINDSTNMYRHAMNVNAALPANADKNIVTGTPLENGKVSCLSCHRAHGTTANMTGRNSKSKGSMLLRMNNRGVCYNCHNSAENNLPK